MILKKHGITLPESKVIGTVRRTKVNMQSMGWSPYFHVSWQASYHYRATVLRSVSGFYVYRIYEI